LYYILSLNRRALSLLFNTEGGLRKGVLRGKYLIWAAEKRGEGEGNGK
jgi:hypothetical protein